MFAAAFKALAQMFTPPFRAVLLKSVGLAILLLIMLGIGLQRVFAWLSAEGAGYLEGVTGPGWHTPLHVLLWIVTVVAGHRTVRRRDLRHAGGHGLRRELLLRRDRRRGRARALPGRSARHGRCRSGPRASQGIKTALLALLVYLIAVPFLLFAGIGFLIFFVANTFLLGREYFLLAAMRFHSVEDAKRLRKTHHGTVMLAGAFIAAFVSIPILNLATPLFGMAFMMHVHKRIAGQRRELIEHT